MVVQTRGRHTGHVDVLGQVRSQPEPRSRRASSTSSGSDAGRRKARLTASRLECSWNRSITAGQAMSSRSILVRDIDQLIRHGVGRRPRPKRLIVLSTRQVSISNETKELSVRSNVRYCDLLRFVGWPGRNQLSTGRSSVRVVFNVVACQSVMRWVAGAHVSLPVVVSNQYGRQFDTRPHLPVW